MQEALPRNTLLFGNRGSYTIHSVIGRGGFGITYRAAASESYMPPFVAIKEFFPKDICSRSADPYSDDVIVNSPDKFDMVTHLRDRFIKESRNIEECDFPGIVKVLDTVECNGTAYMVMELVEGLSLKQLMQESDSPTGALPVDMAADMIYQLAEALDYLHGKNIMHLDVKPDNLMLTNSGDRLVLIDFGLSRRFNDDGTSDSDILTAISKGYAPPEQYNGVTSFSPESDIYSLGATFYKLLTGVTPPEPMILYDNPELLDFPSYIPSNYRNAILSAMVFDHNTRINTAAAFVQIMEHGSLSTTKVYDDGYYDEVEYYDEPDGRRSNRGTKIFLNFLLIIITLVSGAMFVNNMDFGWQVFDGVVRLTNRQMLICFVATGCVSVIGLIARSVAIKTLMIVISSLSLIFLVANMGLMN